MHVMHYFHSFFLMKSNTQLHTTIYIYIIKKLIRVTPCNFIIICHKPVTATSQHSKDIMTLSIKFMALDIDHKRNFLEPPKESPQFGRLFPILDPLLYKQYLHLAPIKPHTFCNLIYYNTFLHIQVLLEEEVHFCYPRSFLSTSVNTNPGFLVPTRYTLLSF